MAPLLDTTAVTTTAMLGEVRATRDAARSAEARLLLLAAEWADAHPQLPDVEGSDALSTGDPAEEWGREFDEDRGIPGWAWSATAPFAAALGRTTVGGDALIRDALVLRHRLPRTWRRVVRGELEAWRARRIAKP